MSMDLKNLTDDVITLAKQAGDYLQDVQNKILAEDISEKGQGDLVSHADHTSESILREGLQKILPGSIVMGEEDSPDASGGEFRWIVDPLDGTLNYLQGIPVYAVSIALERAQKGKEWGDPVIGVIHVPALKNTYSGWSRGGAWKNGKRLLMQEPPSIQRAVLATGFPFKNRDQLDTYLSAFGEIFRQVANVRRIGSAACDLAWVAEGVFHGFWEMGLKPWDIAAGALLIQEAGGVITDFWKNPVLSTCWPIAATYDLHEFLYKILNKNFPSKESLL